MLARQDAKQVADEGRHGAHQDGSRKESAVIVGGEQYSCNMWHSQSNEGNRTAEGSNNGREQPCDNEQPVTHTYHVNTKILGIALTQHQCIEGFDEQEGTE